MSYKTDIIGQFVMQNLRDVALELCDGLCDERFDSPGHKEMQVELRQLSAAQKELLRKCVAYCVDGGINDFIYRLEDKKSKAAVALAVVPRAEISTERLHSNLHGEGGWKERFSKFDRGGRKRPNKSPEPTTMAVTSRAPSSTSRASHGRGSS